MNNPAATETVAPPATVVNALARGWAAKHPDLTKRIQRAVALVANVEPGASGFTFVVEGETDTYLVKVNQAERTSTCTCADHTYRATRCKHILAVALFIKGNAS